MNDDGTLSIFGFIGSLLLGGAFATLFYRGGRDAEAAHEAFAAESVRRSSKSSVALGALRPLIEMFSSVVATMPIDAKREQLRVKLLKAGSPGGLSPDEFIATRFIAVLVGGLLGFLIDDLGDLFPIVTVALMMLGYIYPDIYVNGMIQKRQRRIFRDMPDFLDTLRLAVDAGLDLNSALGVCVEKGRRGPLLDELEKVERDVRLGRTRKEAFKAFAERLQMTEINSFVLALIQADQLGASVGPILKVQAEVSRTRRWQAAEVLVNKMPMKMLAPLVTLIFPASFIILFTPLLIQYLQSTD